VKHCLVVDESRVIRKVVCHILEEMKFYAEEAAGSMPALETCRMQMPDVVLVNLANSGSIDLVRALRREKAQKQPIIIATMTEHDAGQIAEAVSAGADEYALKPFDRDFLKEKFAQIGLV
jgi:two-component system, chemotaxis family, chemotaxis protein CheY